MLSASRNKKKNKGKKTYDGYFLGAKKKEKRILWPLKICIAKKNYKTKEYVRFIRKNKRRNSALKHAFLTRKELLEWRVSGVTQNEQERGTVSNSRKKNIYLGKREKEKKYSNIRVARARARERELLIISYLLLLPLSKQMKKKKKKEMGAISSIKILRRMCLVYYRYRVTDSHYLRQLHTLHFVYGLWTIILFAIFYWKWGRGVISQQSEPDKKKRILSLI